MNKYSNSINFRLGFILLFSLFLSSCDSSNKAEIDGLAEIIDTSPPDTLTELEEILLDTTVYKEQTSDIATEIADAVLKESEEKIAPVPSQIKKTLLPKDASQTPITSTQENYKAEQKEISVTKTPEVAKEFSHLAFDELLKKYVSGTGKVNYQGFKTERTKLQSYLTELKDYEPKASDSKNKKLAFWINVYNAFTIELILKNNIPSSIMSINNGKAWDVAFVEIGTKKYTLNNIEHDIIRKQFPDPRIHFACVCAAKSCPKLLNTAYTEANINSKLDEQAKYFINDTSKNQISDGNLKISQLFNWYASDFGEVNSYIRKYYSGTFKDDKKIEFLEYDWSLNN